MPTPPPKRPAVFLDRDGTLNAGVVRQGKPFPPASLDEFTLLPGVADGCAKLQAAGFALVVVTNQPDVGRGTQSQAVVESMHHRLCTLIPAIDLIKVCYHAGEAFNQPCACQKPKPGMLVDAATELGLDLTNSWMVGDRWRDIDCGNAANCHTVFIECHYNEALRSAPDFVVHDFPSAVAEILAHSLSKLAH